MTHRDRVGDPPGRRGAAGDAGHRQGFPTPSGGSPRRPERRLPKAFGRRRLRLAMPRIATPRAPGRKPWEAVSMSHYQRSLVFDTAEVVPFCSAIAILEMNGESYRLNQSQKRRKSPKIPA